MCGGYPYSQRAGRGEPVPEGGAGPGAFHRCRWQKGLPGCAGATSAPRAGYCPSMRGRRAPRISLPSGRRCALPAQGFYAWDAQKRRYRVWLPGHPALYMVGLWIPLKGDRFVILTTAPNASVAGIHSRMLELISSESLSRWLRDCSASPHSAIARWTAWRQPGPLFL